MSVRQGSRLLRALLAAALMLGSTALSAAEVEVRGLFAGSALLQINGESKMLKQGATWQGVTLVSASSKEAVVSIHGKQHRLGMSKRISASFTAAENNEIRLAPGRGGHFVTPARINNQPVTVMVDTGATAVAMNLPQAKALGIDYRNGTPTRVGTANGVVTAYRVMLAEVTVGTVTVKNVEGLVNVGNFPDVILLGNSYLQRVRMFTENGVLVFQSQY